LEVKVCRFHKAGTLFIGWFLALGLSAFVMPFLIEFLGRLPGYRISNGLYIKILDERARTVNIDIYWDFIL